MVNTTLPLPILKYLEMRPEAVERITLEYPFYQLPRVARILIQSKESDNDVQELNFFGFNKQKLNQYSLVFLQHSIEPIVAIEEVDPSLEISSEPEVPFHDVNIVVSELEHLSEEEKSQIQNDETIELDVNAELKETIINEEPIFVSVLEANDFDLTKEELAPISHPIEPIEIDFDTENSLPDEELSEILTREEETLEITEDTEPNLDDE